jgi:hypothetical protein
VFAVVIAGAALLLLVLLAASFPVMRAFSRKSARGARNPSVVRYVEFLSWCAGAGFGRRAGETPAEHAARLGADEPVVSEPMDALAALADKALWAPPNGLDADEVARAADTARDALAGTLTRPKRLLAASGWGRWRAKD